MPGSDPTVALVDPDDGLFDRLGGSLRDAGWRVLTVRTAGDCLDRVTADDVDAVVTRQTLSDLDGLRLLRAIRLAHRSLPVVLAPVEGSATLAGRAIDAGVSAYLAPTEEPSVLVDRLRRSVERQDDTRDGESQERYRNLLEISPAPINLFDEDGEIIWGNDAVLDLLGLADREELVGRSIFEFIHEDDRAVAREELAAVIEEKTAMGPTRMRLRRGDGAIRHILVSTAVGDLVGTAIGQAVVLDVTEHHDRERQLHVLDTWLRHNIRNDMNVIRGLAEDVADGRADDPAETARTIRSHVDHLVAQAERERSLITRLTAPPEHTELDVAATVRDAVEACRSRHPAADITLDVDGAITVETVPEIGDAVEQLVDNAVVHHDGPTPTVTVTVHSGDRPENGGAERRYPTITVADDGPGIPPAELESLQSERVPDQLTHTSGLGLVGVYWTMRLAGGRVTFRENEPRGTIVELTL